MYTIYLTEMANSSSPLISVAHPPHILCFLHVINNEQLFIFACHLFPFLYVGVNYRIKRCKKRNTTTLTICKYYYGNEHSSWSLHEHFYYLFTLQLLECLKLNFDLLPTVC